MKPAAAVIWQDTAAHSVSIKTGKIITQPVAEVILLVAHPKELLDLVLREGKVVVAVVVLIQKIHTSFMKTVIHLQ